MRAGMVEDPKDYEWSGYGRAVRGEKSCVRGVVGLWGNARGVKAALAEYRVFLFEEGSTESSGRAGVAMRFGQWGGLRVLRDLRVGVVG